MASGWQHNLMAAAGEIHSTGAAIFTPESILLTVAFLVSLVSLLALCACKESSFIKTDGSNEAEEEAGIPVGCANAAEHTALAVEIPVDGEAVQNAMTLTPNELGLCNGVVQNGPHGISPNSHSRQASNGSGQLRPTSLRELPDLPVNNHRRNHSGGAPMDKSCQGRGSDEPNKGDIGAYDHLGRKVTANKAVAVNYDHINLESPHEHCSGATPISEVDTASEDPYTQVREPTYDVVKEIRSRPDSRVKSSGDYDPYAKVKDDDDKEDPYAKVRDDRKRKADEDDDDDGDYAHLKSDHVVPSLKNLTTANVKEQQKEDEDPYEKVMGDSASGQVVAGRESTDLDDVYSVVSEGSLAPVVVFAGAASPRLSSAAAQNRQSAFRGATGTSVRPVDALQNSANLCLQYADESDSGGYYATVVKERNASSSQAPDQDVSDNVEEIEPYFTTTPPEPPRMYGVNEVVVGHGAIGGSDTVSQPVSPSSSRHDTREHRYTKVTARESLASMTARNALNAYEIVPDMAENTYATVDGGSGDGIVRYTNQTASSLPRCVSELSETYAEIGASASGGYVLPAPAPPSLETLHSMTKSTSSHGEGDHGFTLGNAHRMAGASTSPPAASSSLLDDGYASVSRRGFSPSETALPQIPRAGTSGSIGSLGSLGEDVVIKGVTLHADYHSVKDCIESENDPNYESVDEALSKASAAVSHAAPPSTPAGMPAHHVTSTDGAGPRVSVVNHISHRQHARGHEYEEVTASQSPTATRVSAIAVTEPSEKAASPSSLMHPRAAEVRERVLQTHMYEEVSEVKRNSKRKSNTDRKTGVNSAKM